MGFLMDDALKDFREKLASNAQAAWETVDALEKARADLLAQGPEYLRAYGILASVGEPSTIALLARSEKVFRALAEAFGDSRRAWHLWRRIMGFNLSPITGKIRHGHGHRGTFQETGGSR